MGGQAGRGSTVCFQMTCFLGEATCARAGSRVGPSGEAVTRVRRLVRAAQDLAVSPDILVPPSLLISHS